MRKSKNITLIQMRNAAFGLVASIIVVFIFVFVPESDVFLGRFSGLVNTIFVIVLFVQLRSMYYESKDDYRRENITDDFDSECEHRYKMKCLKVQLETNQRILKFLDRLENVESSDEITSVEDIKDQIAVERVEGQMEKEGSEKKNSPDLNLVS